ncbi:MAG TPA: methyltransferase domain-containing protein [Sedimentisphaerales bacterium]|nr:methyltransferase domain-containing protein [Sedimentisphaerales bacterium]
MNGRKVTLKFMVLLVCLLTLVGCKNAAEERDKAVAEAEKAKAELAKVKAIIEEIRSERDELKETLDTISENWEKASSELVVFTQAHDDLLVQVKELTKERDSAIVQAKDAKAQVERLGKQLKEKTEELRAYEEWVKELQATIKGLEGQVEKVDNQWTEQSAEEVSEQSDDTREPDVHFVPTPQVVVDKMLELAKIKKTDLVYDLGCGDGRIVVTAAKRYGCKAIGYDIDPQRVKESLENVRKNAVGHLVRIEQKDIFTLDLSKANVITLYLLPGLNVELIPQLEKLKPGSRIVSHDFGMEGISPDKAVKITSNEDDDEHEIYLWTSPLKKIPD